MARTPRPPIVAVMGHIDHGKSSLLDYIRKANVTAGEAGGITQHVSAYEAEHEHEGAVRKITFLDTPGHEAFRALRARGAAAADVAILVVAADEGVKPQTLEALNAILEANTPFVVALTKIDKNGADPERAKMSLLEHGVYLEGLGGSIAYAPVSSKTGEGVPELLDLVLLTADLAELTADTSLPGSGFILESSQDPRQGLSATLIIKDGTLAVGSFAVAGEAYAPIRFIENFTGTRIPEGVPSQPVRVSGWTALPPAGTPWMSVKARKEAETLVAEAKRAAAEAARAAQAAAADEDGKAVVPLILKADVTGSIEAIKHELAKISHDRVSIRILSAGIGAVAEGDVKTAVASGAIIIAFTVGVDAGARDLAERSGVTIESFAIIYELKEYVEKLVAERAPKVATDETLGIAKALKIFSAGNTKQVMGARLTSGAFTLGGQVKIVRGGTEVIGFGTLLNLQLARADQQEIRVEGEFGLQLESKAEVKPGDELIAFRRVEA
jgi:translation initiation factor IF-2